MSEKIVQLHDKDGNNIYPVTSFKAMLGSQDLTDTFVQKSGDTMTGNLTAPVFIGSLQGNAETATKLATAKTISLTGPVTGSGSFDGSENLNIATATNIPITSTPPDDANIWIDPNENGDGNCYTKTETNGLLSGKADLDSTGKVPTSQLPEISSVKILTGIISTIWIENEDTGVKSQQVAISGILSTHTAKVDHDTASIDGTSNGYTIFVEEENQYLTYITNGYAETYDGGITFYIFGNAPTVEIPIVVEIV